MPDERKCGCKGIRTCLLCEKGSSFATKSNLPKEAKCSYTYCPHCHLCWPDDGEPCVPLFLDGVKIFPDFVSEDEEARIVSNIDKIAWMPSQSGRRKQDFGPKVNFKKKKVRIGEFRGFPEFTSPIVRRFQNLPGLSDFEPVELCHLEYTPERGSSIDPHVDDFWLWGERLVTVNLGSPTVLTLVPCTDGSCDCNEKSDSIFNPLTTAPSCNHRFSHVPAMESTGKSAPQCNVATVRNDSKNGSTFSSQNFEEVSYQNGHTTQDSKVADSVPLESTLESNPPTAHLTRMDSTGKSAPQCNIVTVRNDSDIDSTFSSQNCEDSYQNGHTTQDSIVADSVPLESNCPTAHLTRLCEENGTNIRTMCSLFRSSCSVSEVAVSVALPARSLVVLAGCARYNWTHEIKRQDVVSRRLAMTFRELTPEFLDGGKESVIGKELLTIANGFCDL